MNIMISFFLLLSFTQVKGLQGIATLAFLIILLPPFNLHRVLTGIKNVCNFDIL
jgi:hypothetical protein